MCGLQKMYHKSGPAYYGGEKSGEFASTAEREKRCKGFNENPNVTDFTHVFERLTPGEL
jgi:hypothetical protein